MSKITKQGVYDIDIDAYHGDPNLCDGPSISSSGLRTILNECPARYFAFSPYNPNPFPNESKKALDIGRAAHCLVLGEPEFNRHFVICPHDKLSEGDGVKWNKDWKAEIKAGREKRALIRKKDFEDIETLAAVQKRSIQVLRAFEDGEPEKSLIWRDKETGIWLRSRPDWLPHDPAKRLVTEFKSCVSIEPEKFSRDCFTYGYHVQVAMIVDGIREVFGVDPMGVCLICQEKDAPYLVEPRLFQDDQIEWGRKLYKRGLKIFAHCMKTGEWPGYTTQPTFIETPYRVAKDMQIGWTDDFGKDIPDGPDTDSGSPPEAQRQRYTAADILGAG